MQVIKEAALVLVLVLMIAHVGLSFRCYSCFSRVSWDQCHNANRSLTTETCSGKEEYCLTEHSRMTNGATYYQKYCAPRDHCNTSACYTEVVAHCERACCQSDLCNGDRRTLSNGFLLFSCALAVVFL